MPLPAGARVGAYEIVSVIGAGGMGQVYRARDPRLKRDVAIKCIHPDGPGGADLARRFLTEARAAARLDHPNICSVYETGEDASGPFIVMPLVEGETLAAKLAHGGLSVDESLAIARQVAAALKAAHENGVLHRDIKPGNIMIEVDGRVRVMDFGLAKLLPMQGGELGDTTSALTSAGMMLGTVSYMSPEQARGQIVDVRSDLFSLGCVVYEMLAGHRPFDGPTAADVIMAILTREPRPLAEERPGTPAAVERIVAKTLQKHPRDRYQSAADMLTDLAAVAAARAGAIDHSSDAPTSAASQARRRKSRLLIASAIVVVLGFAVALSLLFLNHDGSKSPAISAKDHSRLVVLPFENLTRQPEDDWLAGAFSDAISAGLQPVASLSLVPREHVVELFTARSMHEAQTLDPEVIRQLSQRLQVAYYVHGSYQRVGEDLRVVARLVDVERGTIQTQETVTDRAANVLQLEDALAQRLAKRLGAVDSAPAGVGVPASLAAYRAVSTARGLYAQAKYTEGLALLEQAVHDDPAYADAWAWQSKTLSRSTSPAVFAGGSPKARQQQALDAATTAIRLNPTLYEGQVAAALAYRGLGDLKSQREAAQRALTLSPTPAEARALFADSMASANFFSIVGARSEPAARPCVDPQPKLAEAQYREALVLDPLQAGTYVNLANHLLWMRQDDEALRVIDAGIAAMPDNRLLPSMRVTFLVFSNHLEEAERDARATAGTLMTITPASDEATLALIEAARGNVAAAATHLEPAERAGLMNVAARVFLFARAYFVAGRMAEGAAMLERGFKLIPCSAQWAATVPAFEPYRKNALFTGVLARYGAR